MIRPTHVLLPVLALALGVTLAACGDEADGDGGTAAKGRTAQAPGAYDGTDRDRWPPAEIRRLKPGFEPTPYSAAQLRRALGGETTRVMRFESQGKDAWHRCWTWTEPDADGATHRDAACDATGKENGDLKNRRVLWRDLQAHASWPADIVVTSEQTLKTPAGTFDCMHYVVTREDTKLPAEDRYWFAWDLPGPPVKLERYVKGTLAFTMTLVKAGGSGE